MARDHDRVEAVAGTSTGLSLLRSHLGTTADRAMREYFRTQDERAHRRYEAATLLVDMDDDELRRTLLDAPDKAVQLIEEMEGRLLGR